jgi:uncharacterized membrane protein YfcA
LWANNFSLEVIGYFAALLTGISLGLIGGGGSILTMPVMVYLFGLQPILATSYSLFVVGSSSLVGSFNNLKKGLISLRTAFLFGAASIITVFITRKFIIPHIPKNIFNIGNFVVSQSMLTMVLFAVLMFLASISMIRGRDSGTNQAEASHQKSNHYKLFGYGIGIGLVTGFLGAGGGFLLVPALVLLTGLSMKEAIGTSLLIIALNSLIGFAGDFGHFTIDWLFLVKITIIVNAGIFIGGALGNKVEGETLKKSFGWFLLVMGTFILVREIFL